MATVKTAISIQKALFTEADQLARSLNLSRSQVFAMAIEAFIESYRNKQLLDAINAAYAEESVEDAPYRAMRKRQHRTIVEGSW